MALNKEQQLAVDSDSKNIVCIAGAGTGKTFTMISRISRLVKDGVNPNSILVLTFTNAAAAEMRDRYKREHKNEVIPTFCTFHSFCYSLILRDTRIRSILGYSKPPTIPSESEVRKLFTECKQICSTKLSDDKLRGKEELSPSDQFQYGVFWKMYHKMLKQNNFITFDTMCYKVCELFSNDDPTVSSYKHMYKYLFVDEFQDTDPKQWKFISSFKDSNLFVVGDAKQAIYSFRDADSSIIKSIASSDDWETIKLVHNYRSTSQICDFANKIHEQWKSEAYNLDILSDKSGQEVFKHGEFDPHSVNARELVNDMLFCKGSEESMAILCRTNNEIAELITLLNDMGVKFSTKNPSKHLSDILVSSIDSEHLVNWLSSMLSSKQYNDYLKIASVDPHYQTEEGFRELYGDKLSKYIKRIDEIREILAGDIKFAYQKCADICKLLKLPCINIELQGICNEDIINYLVSIVDQINDNSSLYVGTIHSVKGLEYDVVHLLGVDGKSFRLIGEDNLNLYYVGVTRAKKTLHIWRGLDPLYNMNKTDEVEGLRYDEVFN